MTATSVPFCTKLVQLASITSKRELPTDHQSSTLTNSACNDDVEREDARTQQTMCMHEPDAKENPPPVDPAMTGPK